MEAEVKLGNPEERKVGEGDTAGVQNSRKPNSWASLRRLIVKRTVLGLFVVGNDVVSQS